MPDIDPSLASAIAARLREHLDRQVLKGMTATSTAAAPARTLDPERLLQDMARFMREWRRTNVTVVVVLGHTGPPLLIEHPTDGRCIEMGYLDAAALHRRVPLRLTRVVSADQAEFEVVAPLPGVTFPTVLPAPPYGLPPNGEPS